VCLLVLRLLRFFDDRFLGFTDGGVTEGFADGFTDEGFFSWSWSCNLKISFRGSGPLVFFDLEDLFLGRDLFRMIRTSVFLGDVICICLPLVVGVSVGLLEECDPWR